MGNYKKHRKSRNTEEILESPKTLVYAENLRNHFAAKSIWQTQTFPEGSLHCIGSKLLVLSSLSVLAHFFKIYILFLSGLINKNSQIFMQYSVAAYVHCICLAFHMHSMWGNCNKKGLIKLLNLFCDHWGFHMVCVAHKLSIMFNVLCFMSLIN